jgi:hypothetical protein
MESHLLGTGRNLEKLGPGVMYRSIIPSIQDTEIGRFAIQDQLRQKFNQNPFHKSAG